MHNEDDDNRDLSVADEILQAYQENNNLTRLDITCYNFNSINLRNGEDNNIATTLRRCSNIEYVSLYDCNLTDEHFLPIVEAIREHPSLEHLSLSANNIGILGCEALATLLEDSNCNLHTLEIPGNNIDLVCVNILANSLSNNTKLKVLNLYSNPIDRSRIGDVFCKLICNASSVNSTYLSNHTLEEVSFHNMDHRGELNPLLHINTFMNEYSEINKILRYHPNIDMEPFYDWQSDGEWTLKGLPYVVDWFERAKEAVLDISFIKNGVDRGREAVTEEDEDACISLVDTRKLSAMYQFALAMPILFVPAAHTKASNKKRRRGEGAANS